MPEADLPAKPQGRIGRDRFALPAAAVAGRLMPLALDQAQRQRDALAFSVAVGGLSSQQVAAADVLAGLGRGRLRSAIAALAARWPRAS